MDFLKKSIETSQTQTQTFEIAYVLEWAGDISEKEQSPELTLPLLCRNPYPPLGPQGFGQNVL